METLDKHFRELTRAAFARHGFAQADLAGRWPEIVGEEMAAVSAPERIKWPRQAAETTRQSGGTLVIRAAPGRALELSYAIPRIIERLNQFLGYGAVAQVKLVQAGSWPAPRPAPHIPPVTEPPCAAELASIGKEDLREALERLGKAVAGSPQAKLSIGSTPNI